METHVAAKTLSFYICCCHLAISTSEAWRPYKIEFTNVTSYSLDYSYEINSSISSAGAISFFVNIKRPITNLYSQTLIKVGKSPGTIDMTLINKTLDTCRFFRDPSYEPIVQVFYRELNRSGAFPKRCPLNKKMYFIKDVLINSEHLPPTMPFKGATFDVVVLRKTGNKLERSFGFTIHLKIKVVS